MVALQDRYRFLVIDADQQHRAVVFMVSQVVTEGLDLGNEVASPTAKGSGLDPLYDVFQEKTTICHPTPFAPGKNSNSLKVLWLDFHFPPLRVERKLSPHVASAAKQQGAPQRVPLFIRNQRTKHELLELLPVLMELFLVELVPQELSYDFRFSNVP